jgi:hypothetical protein
LFQIELQKFFAVDRRQVPLAKSKPTIVHVRQEVAKNSRFSPPEHTPSRRTPQKLYRRNVLWQALRKPRGVRQGVGAPSLVLDTLPVQGKTRVRLALPRRSRGEPSGPIAAIIYPRAWKQRNWLPAGQTVAAFPHRTKWLSFGKGIIVKSGKDIQHFFAIPATSSPPGILSLTAKVA